MTAKILFVYNNAFGQYPIIYEYCVNIHQQGYAVYYIGVADKNEKFISAEGINVFHISKTDSRPAWALSSLISVHAKEIGPSIIHVFHFRWCYLLPLKGLFFTNYLLDVRTLHVADKQGKYSSFTFIKNRITWLESQFYRYCIALTTDIRKILTPSYKAIPVIPLGANTGRLQPPDKVQRRALIRQALNAGNHVKVFIYSGTLSPARRIDTIIQAFSRISVPDVMLVIAGDDKDDPQSIINLKNICTALQIKNKVVFTGFLQYNSLIDYYLAADIGLCFIPQTSYYDLQPPTKLFEYMAAGIVPIATNTTANKNIITNGVNGFLCEDNATDLHQTLLKVLEEYPRTSPQIIIRAYQTAQHFSWERIIKNYVIPFYESILNKHRNKK